MRRGVRGRGRVTAGAVALALLAAACTSEPAEPPSGTEVSGVAIAPPGRIVTVEVGELEFSVRCAGTPNPPQPPVVLVSALGVGLQQSWDAVQGRIADFARVCAYDRLGVGQSSRAPRTQTFEDMASQLDGLVTELGLDRPIVLVAHSLGGYVAASFAQRRPDDVAGLLLLDAPGPGYPQSVLDLLPRNASKRGAEERDLWESLLEPKDNAENLDGREAFAATASLSPLGDVPLVALSHTITTHPDSTGPRQQANLESAWEEGQQRWLALSSRARLERVDLAGHDIQNDQPDAVVEAVLDLVD